MRSLNPAYLPGELEQHLRRVNVTAVMVEGQVASPAREVAQRLGLLIVELLPCPHRLPRQACSRCR